MRVQGTEEIIHTYRIAVPKFKVKNIFSDMKV